MTGEASNPVQRALDALYLACIWTAGIAITLMSVIIPIGVVMRYVFGFGAQWPEPIAILLMMVFTFIGAAAAYRAGAHIAVTMLVDRLPAAVQAALARFIHVLMLLICGFVVLYGSRLCMDTMGQSIAELPWLPVGVTYLAIPLGALVTAVFVLEHLFAGSQKHRAVVAFGEAA
ncbi:MAG: TRAP transporter small permease [Rubrivivax sp.]|nr:TRAP transporter small permease [Rubrivivax sp.]MDP3614224.1 TRAP transporter small permease [Rubrivivax sp.]